MLFGLDDALKLTVDVFFPPPTLESQDDAQKTVYKVDGYKDNENMW